MEIYGNTLINDPPVEVSGLMTSMHAKLGLLMDEKIKTAMMNRPISIPSNPSSHTSIASNQNSLSFAIIVSIAMQN